MKKLLLVLTCLLLCGCAREAPEAPPATESLLPSAAMAETQPVSLYDPDHPLEAQYGGELKVYPLTTRKTSGALALGENLLLFSGQGNTTLTLLTGENLTIAASRTLEFSLSPTDPSLRIAEDHLSFYDPVQQQTIVLGQNLKLLSRIVLTEPTACPPVLSLDRTTLFYCTSHALRAWNLASGIHRTVAEIAYDQQAVAALLLEDSVIQCRIQDGAQIRTLFFSAENGRQLAQLDGEPVVMTEGSRYYATLPISTLELQIFGASGTDPLALYPEAAGAECFFLPGLHAALTGMLQEDDRILLQYYELSQGTLASQLTLDPLQLPRTITSGKGGAVWILVYDPSSDQEILYRWNPAAPVFRAENSSSFTLPYTGTQTQPPETLEECYAMAARIEETYGIPILLGEDVLSCQPWDYTFAAETLPPVLLQALKLLDDCLSQYPQTILEQTAAHFSSLKIGLVRTITGSAASGSLETATGVQYMDGTDAYVVIAAGTYARQALYHELFHVMETHILNESTALDMWNELNPADFAYTFGYGEPQPLDSYFSEDSRCFIDTYSMTLPKEDRARVWENALLPGSGYLFQSSTMQAKLTALCKGVREAYGLKKSEEAFPWEQYLDVPLAYAK